MALHSTKLPGLIREALAGGKERYFSDGDNLYLRVQPSGNAAWVIRKRHGKRLVLTTLGQWNDGKGMTLAGAREKAGSLDPKAAAHNMSLGSFLREWFTEEIQHKYRRPHHVQGYLDRIEKDEAGLWNRKLRDVEHLEVFRALKTYAKRRGTVAANRCLSILKTSMTYAVNAGYLSASPIVAMTGKAIGGSVTDRARVLTDEELRSLWTADSDHVPLVRFLMLTGQRIGEAQLATWDHIADGVWTIPAEHAKNGRAHWVPLSPSAKAIIDAQDRHRRKVFGHTSNTAVQSWMKRWCEREKIDPAFTPHDLRRTFATRLNDLGVAPHIVERMLNHTMQGVMKVYNRAEYADERRDAANKWAVELERIVG
jgi:integrase